MGLGLSWGIGPRCDGCLHGFVHEDFGFGFEVKARPKWGDIKKKREKEKKALLLLLTFGLDG